MARSWTYAFGGIGAGFLAGFVLVGMMPNSEGEGWLPISLLLGSFLAGVGSVTGALIGGVEDLLAYFKSRDEAARNAQTQSDSESKV